MTEKAKEEKLLPKHLIAYLDYELEVFADNYDNDYIKMSLIGVSQGMAIVIDDNESYDHELKDIKPLLIPLSEWMKYCTFTSQENCWVSNAVSSDAIHMVENLPKYKFDVLIENHLDVYGLIPSGLALNKLNHEN